MGMADWGATLHPAQCGNCHAAFLVPAHAGAPLCPNCFAARLEPNPALEHTELPELILPFSVAESTLHANLERWLRDIPFKSATLNLNALRARLTRVFMPMYLADAEVQGTWNAQMGFDYLVASSEERFHSGQWISQRINETRVRWEPRAGEIARAYENVSAPAVENHARLMSALGEGNTPALDTTRAISFSPEAISNALVRAPEIANDNAWQFAEREVERRAASDCQTAANAQHHEQFNLRAAFGEPHWTLLLLPMYVTSYSDDDKKWLAVRVNGQTGFVTGEKRASIKIARRWALLLGGIALLAFLFIAFIALTARQVSQLSVFAGMLLFVMLCLCLAAPVPLIIAWQYNQKNKETA